MKTFLSYTMVLMFLGLCNQGYSQEISPETNSSAIRVKVRPFRIGAKLGFPNLAGGNIEYVTPLLKHKLAVFADYSKLSSDFINDKIEEEARGIGNTDAYGFKYFEGGINYYFFKPGYGLYGGVSYGSIGVEGTKYNVESNVDTGKQGTGIIKFTHNSINLKLGAKLGGLFYFRPEIGYSFTALPSSLPVEVKFPDGTSESQVEVLDSEGSPQNLLFKGYMVNIGLGFAF